MELFLENSKDVVAFYINYEECKFKAIGNILITINSFILTMRNVNDLPLNSLLCSPSSFILTMRNVNINLQLGLLRRVKVLY